MGKGIRKRYTYRWAIELNEIEQPVGVIEVVAIDERTESMEIAFRVGKEYWRQGYTSEALSEVLRFSPVRWAQPSMGQM